MVKIEYYVANDEMSDEAYDNNEDRRVFIITEEMIKDLLNDLVELKKGEYIDNDIYILRHEY